MNCDVFEAKPVVSNVKQLRLQRSDFETLKIIGRGAFGEVCNFAFMSRCIYRLFSDVYSLFWNIINCVISLYFGAVMM